MAREKLTYTCSACGFCSTKWLGRCPSCKAWNTFEEVIEEEPVGGGGRTASGRVADARVGGAGQAVSLETLELPCYMRSQTGMSELDRVLGGGLVSGSVILLSGEPGIGKSTLLTQISGTLCQSGKILYVSGEESPGQIKLRAKRLGVTGKGDSLLLLTDPCIETVLREADRLMPDVLIMDSIQTAYTDQLNSAPGSVSQIRESAARLIARAKSSGMSVIMVGHVTKDGTIAGPKILEHMVDAVMCFEGEQQHAYRIIRATKNRFGSTNEIGVFEMTENGLEEVPNPSEAMLQGRPKDVSGSCTVCLMEGTRPLLAEIQALATPSVFPAPRRTVNGFDYNRLCLILAVLEKRLGLRFSTYDVYVNVIGGLRIDEPAADLAAALALISGMRDVPIAENLLAVGEIGLGGECRTVTDMAQRCGEAARLGFTQMILPRRSARKIVLPEGLTLLPAGSLYEALRYIADKKDSKMESKK